MSSPRQNKRRNPQTHPEVAWRNKLLCHKYCTKQRFSSEQEAVLKATAVRSPLPVMSSILPCPPLSLGVGGSGRGVKGEGAGEISSTLPYTAPPHGASP